MKAGRNDPCPCGSGRKYKKCCEAADRAADAGLAGGKYERVPKHEVLEAAAQEVLWEIDAVPIPIGIADGGSHRPATVIVTAGELVVRAEIRDRLGGELEDLAKAYEREIVIAAQGAGTFPERVAIRFEDLREPLQALLDPREIEVQVADHLPNAEMAAKALIEHLSGEVLWPPFSVADTWASWRLPSASVRDLFDAAADFWRRAPWKSLANEQAPRATFTSGRAWTAGVMGDGGEQFGLCLYSDPDDLYRVAAIADVENGLGRIRGRVLMLSLDPVARLPDAMAVEARTAGWHIAGPEAFPILMTINTPGGGVSRADIEDLTALLRAIPDFAEAHAADLLLEQRSGVPARLLQWRDEATGLLLQYDGEIAHERSLAGMTGNDLDEAGWYEAHEDDAVRRQLSRIAREVTEEMGPDADPEYVVAAITERAIATIDGLEAESIPVFGGLNAVQVTALLEADWSDATGPIQLNRTLPPERLSSSDLLANCRTILGLATEQDGLRATEAGNLGLAVVRELIERCRLEPVTATYLREQKRVREDDVWPIHRARVVLELAGALRRGKRQFAATREGERLTRDEYVGELFALLFETYFRKFNIAYGRLGEWPRLQMQIPFTLYRLSRMQPEWSTAEELMADVVLPFASDSAPESPSFDRPVLILETQVFEPLVEFGLLERESDVEQLLWSEMRRYRTTSLLREFLTFGIAGKMTG